MVFIMAALGVGALVGAIAASSGGDEEKSTMEITNDIVNEAITNVLITQSSSCKNTAMMSQSITAVGKRSKVSGVSQSIDYKAVMTCIMTQKSSLDIDEKMINNITNKLKDASENSILPPIFGEDPKRDMVIRNKIKNRVQANIRSLQKQSMTLSTTMNQSILAYAGGIVEDSDQVMVADVVGNFTSTTTSDIVKVLKAETDLYNKNEDKSKKASLSPGFTGWDVAFVMVVVLVVLFPVLWFGFVKGLIIAGIMLIVLSGILFYMSIKVSKEQEKVKKEEEKEEEKKRIEKEKKEKEAREMFPVYEEGMAVHVYIDETSKGYISKENNENIGASSTPIYIVDIDDDEPKPIDKDQVIMDRDVAQNMFEDKDDVLVRYFIAGTELGKIIKEKGDMKYDVQYDKDGSIERNVELNRLTTP